MITKEQIAEASEALEIISHYAEISPEGLRLAKDTLRSIEDSLAPGIAEVMDNAASLKESAERSNRPFDWDGLSRYAKADSSESVSDNGGGLKFEGVKVQSLVPRVQILNEAAALTSGDRDASYGDPKVNLACAGELKQLARVWLEQGIRGELDPGEMEAIDQVLTKVARVLTGAYKRDNYVDGACYFAIAGECGEPRPVVLDLKCGDKASPSVIAAYERLQEVARRAGKVEVDLDEAHEESMTRVRDLAAEAQRKSAERAAAGDTAPWKEDRRPGMKVDSPFAGAPRYHTGGPLDLKPGEIPAILRRAEPYFPARMLADALAKDVMSSGGGAVMVIKAGSTRADAKRAIKSLFNGGDVYRPEDKEVSIDDVMNGSRKTVAID